MPEINTPPCLTHGSLPRANHSENFRGAVDAIVEIIETVSGVGTISYSKCPYGYDANFNGLVRALEDLNTSISGIQGGGGGSTASGIVAGSGIYITQSGSFEVINAVPSTSSGIVAGSGIYISQSGSFEVINATITSASGLTISAGSGIYLSDAGTKINLAALGTGSVTVLYSGTTALISGTDTQGGGGGGSASGTAVIVSGDPGTGYTAGSLWFDTNEGRLFVYASGNGVSDPAWYQTNAEAIASKGEAPPSGTGLNAPPRDGSIWFNSLMGSLFVYDAVTSGWYETGPSRSFAYGPAAPPPSTQGAGWYDSANSHLRVWDGSSWIQV